MPPDTRKSRAQHQPGPRTQTHHSHGGITVSSIRLVQASAALVALVAAYVSYIHIAAVALAVGERPEVAYALPVTIDALMIMSTLAWLAEKRNPAYPGKAPTGRWPQETGRWRRSGRCGHGREAGCEHRRAGPDRRREPVHGPPGRQRPQGGRIMTGDDVYRCSYCGQLAPLHRSIIYWTFCETMEDGRTELFAPAVYCSDWCGQAHSRGSVGRG